ncbi:OTU domain-containing protein 6B [Xylaria sp. FL1042]|nr:OTU domain-containing protein 6B [Xylaria sp. FL1042]
METSAEMQARHRKEQRDLQSRITSKKKNATKKTRRGVNDECAFLERELKERQESELDALIAGGEAEEEQQQQQQQQNGEPNGAAGQNNTAVNGTESRRDADADADADADTDTNQITDKLKKTTVSFDLPRPSEPPAQTQGRGGGGGGGGGKKRNRQKDRLARRAAERESAVEAAEREARSMTDHRGLERSSLERAFSAHGLVEHEIPPDGHCLFSAVADQLAQQDISISPSQLPGTATATDTDPDSRNGATPPYRVVRRVATEYMERYPDGFAPFLEEPLESYVPRIRDTAEWGGQLELLALASAYQVEIKVVQDGRTETIEPSGEGGGGQGERQAGDKADRRTIWLAYYRHGYGLGEHYNSLRKR